MIPTNFLATRVGTSVDYDRGQTLSQLDINVLFNKYKHYHSLTSYLTMRLPSSSIWNVYILSGTPDKSSLQEPILVSGKKGFKHFAFIEMFPSLWFFASTRLKLAVERQMGHEGDQA